MADIKRNLRYRQVLRRWLPCDVPHYAGLIPHWHHRETGSLLTMTSWELRRSSALIRMCNG
jgi:hypothetical protein